MISSKWWRLSHTHTLCNTHHLYHDTWRSIQDTMSNLPTATLRRLFLLTREKSQGALLIDYFCSKKRLHSIMKMQLIFHALKFSFSEATTGQRKRESFNECECRPAWILTPRLKVFIFLFRKGGRKRLLFNSRTQLVSQTSGRRKKMSARKFVATPTETFQNNWLVELVRRRR